MFFSVYINSISETLFFCQGKKWFRINILTNFFVSFSEKWYNIRMKNATSENIQAIIFGILRGESQGTIGERLGLHRQTVKKIFDSPEFKATVASLEKLFMRGTITDERKSKNAVILKAMSMSHLDREDVLRTAEQIAHECYADSDSHLFVEMEDVDNFCQDFNIVF